MRYGQWHVNSVTQSNTLLNLLFNVIQLFNPYYIPYILERRDKGDGVRWPGTRHHNLHQPEGYRRELFWSGNCCRVIEVRNITSFLTHKHDIPTTHTSQQQPNALMQLQAYLKSSRIEGHCSKSPCEGPESPIPTSTYTEDILIRSKGELLVINVPTSPNNFTDNKWMV